MTMRDANGRLLPGSTINPGGRPRMPISLDKILKQRLLAHPELGDQIIEATIKLACKPDSKAIELLWERIDGKLPSELAIKGVILHIGNEYALQGLHALETDASERQHRLGMGLGDVVEGEIVSDTKESKES